MIWAVVLAGYLAIVPIFVLTCVLLIFLDIHILPRIYISILDPIMSVSSITFVVIFRSTQPAKWASDQCPLLACKM